MKLFRKNTPEEQELIDTYMRNYTLEAFKKCPICGNDSPRISTGYNLYYGKAFPFKFWSGELPRIFEQALYTCTTCAYKWTSLSYPADMKLLRRKLHGHK